MNRWMKNVSLALLLTASLAAPAWADAPSTAGSPTVISAPASMPQLDHVPAAVTVDGKAITFDQWPVMLDGTLMVPVRFVAEAAGGVVNWDSGIHLVHVQMPDRTIMIHFGNTKAQMHQAGVVYTDRNFIAMVKAPVIISDRMLISADALTTVFGFKIRFGQADTLELTSPTE
jgi:hypothetical protein